MYGMVYYILHCWEKGKCSDNSQCYENTLLTEVLSFYYYAFFRKFRTSLHSEPGTPLFQILKIIVFLADLPNKQHLSNFDPQKP